MKKKQRENIGNILMKIGEKRSGNIVLEKGSETIVKNSHKKGKNGVEHLKYSQEKRRKKGVRKNC